MLLAAGLSFLAWRRGRGARAERPSGAVERRQTALAAAPRTNEGGHLPTRGLGHDHALVETLLDSVPAIILLLTPEGAVERVNSFFERLTGYRLDEIHGKDWFSTFIPERDRPRISALFRAAVGGAPTRGNVNAILLRGGEERLIEWSDSVIRDADGRVTSLLAVGHDITEARRGEELLRQNEAKYRALIEGLDEMLFRMRIPDGRYDYISPSAERVVGISAETLLADPLHIARVIHPNSRPFFEQAWAEIERGVVRPRYEYEIVDQQGRSRWIAQSNTALRDVTGKLVAIEGICRDETEQKRVEQRLRESEELYRSLYESMIDAFVVDDLDGYIVECNRTYQEMLGYSLNELRHLTYLDLTPARWHQMEAEIVRDQLQVRGYTDIYEKEYRRKDGVIIPVEIRAFLRRGSDGQTIGGWAIVRDISARKATERELRQSRELLRDAIAVAGIGVFNHDQVAETIYWSPEQRKIYGWGAEEEVTLQRFGDCIHPDDKAAVFEAVKRAHDPAGDGRYDVEHRILRRDGTIRWLASKSQTFFEDLDGAPRPVRTVGVAFDVTNIRAADEVLLESELRLRQAQSLAKVGNWELDLASGALWWSDEIFQIFEIDKERFGASYEAFLGAIHPDDRDAVSKAYETSVANRTPYQITHRLRMPDGRVKWVEERCQTTYDPGGKPIRSSGTVQDISDRVRAEQEARQRESWLLAILENSPTEIVLKDLDLNCIAVSKNVAENRGIAMKDVIGKSMREVFPSNIAAIYEVADQKVLESNDAVRQDMLEIAEEGERYIHNVEFPLRDDAGRMIGIGSLSTDMTEFKRIELGMEALSTELIALEGAAFYERAALRLAELLSAEYAFITRAEAQRSNEARVIAVVQNGALSPSETYMLRGTPSEDVLKGHGCVFEEGVQRRYPADRYLAEKGIEAYAGEPLFDQGGQILGQVAVMSRKRFRDVAVVGTLLKIFAVAIAAAIVRERNRRQYIDLFEFAPSGLVMVDRQGRIALINRQAEEMFGWSKSELLGKPIEVLVPPGSRDAHELLRRQYQSSARRRQMADSRALLRGRRKDGTEFPAEIDLAPVQSESGTMIAAAIRDVTTRQLLEAELAQATKMEAIGKLTGGMAHDFNNYLGVIIGNLDLLRERNIPDAKARKLVEAALSGALRGAEVTQSLLAFARRQPLNVDYVDANSRIRGIVKLLTPTLGKDVKIATALAPDLWTVKVDGAQLDSCIVNLAGNARDAMPKGGTVTIGTANARLDDHYAKANPDVATGDYVMIEVSDAGGGMTKEVQARAFEPFFTTKGPGHGSGLGLSMVYGFVKQSGGHVKIYSEVGHGTSVRIYLPRGHLAAGTRDEGVSAETMPRGNGEVVLVVEDNQDLREASVAQLTMLGYDVIEADGSAAALAAIESSVRSVDLLFTDIVMPGTMNGYELANEVTVRRPTVKVLLASGFPGETLERTEPHIRKWQLLRKPYRMEELGRAVHAALQRPTSEEVG